MRGVQVCGVDLVIGLLLGVTLAACAGLRAFLPLFVVGLAFRMGWQDTLTLVPAFDWITTNAGLACLGSATVLEIAADKVPALDHALDSVATFVRPAAGGVSVLAVLGQEGMAGYVAAVALAGAVTLPVHLLKSSLRVAGNVTSGGLAAPAASTAEDVTALSGTVLAFVAPVVAGVVSLAALFGLVWVARRVLRRRKT